MIRKSGQIFSDEILARIGELVAQQPDISRRQLSLRVCEWMDWRNAAGKLQEMSCRKALLHLHRAQAIRLPEIARAFAFQNPARATKPPPITPVECSLDQLGQIELVRVVRGNLSPVWRGMLDAYHYLKSGPLCGAQIRYLVRSPTHGWVAALSFSACAYRVECRDKWIGWSDDARRQNLNRVVNNSRFLIPPMVKVKGLASHVLSLAATQLPADWEAAYGYRPTLLETYVERGRFTGSCYAGAGWYGAGTTSGIGRKETKKIMPKDVYLLPLRETWRDELCRTSEGVAQVVADADGRPPRDWIDEEFGRAELGDRRLSARLLKMAGRFYEQPQSNIPLSCATAKEAKAAYRFLDNPDVTWDAILRSHVLATLDRLREQSTVLVATDTTSLNYSSHPAAEGMGYICDNENARGVFVHDTMAFTPDGTPLGLLDVQVWARESIGVKEDRKSRDIEDKESVKWLKAYRAVSEAQKQCRTARLVMVADREGDIHELFCERASHPRNAEMLVRAERSRNRKVHGEDGQFDYLWTLLGQSAVLATRDLLVPPAEDRPARKARLEVRAAPVQLQPPKRKPHLPSVDAWAVYARETNVPQGVEPIEWMLLGTTPVADARDALERLEWYAKRWGIEVYHRILKSGCNVERRQLATVDRIFNCLAIDMVVAWRIFHLTMQGREAPQLSCAIYFAEHEWKALTTFVHKRKESPPTPPTLNEAIQLLGRLGGHLGRAGDSPPGSEVLWRGMSRLADISEAYALYR